MEFKNFEIVIVDDVKAISNSLKREFKLLSKNNHINFNINDFQDPQQGLLFIKENPADLIISDIKMPYLTGDKLVEEIKKKFPEMPVIVITGFATKENIISVLKADKNCVILSKPWELEDLVKAVGKLLNIHLSIPEE